MYKDSEKKRQAERERQRKRREGVTKGVTTSEKGVTSDTKGVTSLADYPDIIDKLTDKKVWRPRLEQLCLAFSKSPYKADVWLGVPDNMFTIGGSDHRAYNLTEVCELLETTR